MQWEVSKEPYIFCVALSSNLYWIQIWRPVRSVNYMTDKNLTIMLLILLLLPNKSHPFVLRTKVLAP